MDGLGSPAAYYRTQVNVPEGIFDDLTSLTDVDIRNTWNKGSMPDGLFDGLSSLGYVRLSNQHREPPNFEDPKDADALNDYELMVRATSGTGDRQLTSGQKVVVTVTDVDEPPEAPEAPEAPEVTGVSTTSLRVQWTEPENQGPPIQDYDYRYRIHEPRGRWTEVTDSPIDTLETTITDLDPGTRYDVQVRASNDEGTGPWSESGTGATLEPPWNDVVTPWLARFTRTVAGHVITGVEQRFADASVAASQVILSGHLLSPDERAAHGTGEPPEFTFEPGKVTPVEFWELVAGSSINLVGPVEANPAAQGAGGRWGLWGRGDWSSFTGSERDLELDGSVITSTIGADYRRDRLLFGLALAYSSGSGSFRVDDGDSGDLDASLLSVHPYLRLALHERLSVWSLLGFGALGDLGLDPESVPKISTDIGMLMGAFGAQGNLLSADASGGLELTAKTDGFLLTAHAEDGEGLVRATADVIRLRLLLKAGVRGIPLLGGSLVPAIELGARYDDGAAERGAGMTLGGSLGYTLPAWGLQITANGQGLVLHRDSGFKEWSVGGTLRVDPGAPGRGVALSVAPAWGSASTGAQSLWAAPDASILAPAAVPRPSATPVRLESSIGYGIELPGGAITPFAGFSGSPLDGEARTWHLGGRLQLDSGLSLSLDGSRQEQYLEPPAHTVRLIGSFHY